MSHLRTVSVLSLLLVALALSAGLAAAQHGMAGNLMIENAWARATPPGADVGAGYLTIRNTGSRSDTLVGGAAEVSARVEVHQMAHVQGMMEMRPVPKLEIAPGQTVTFKPGGYHLMLMGLKRPLREGERVTVVLHFAQAGDVRVELQVGGVAAGEAPMSAHGGMQMKPSGAKGSPHAPK